VSRGVGLTVVCAAVASVKTTAAPPSRLSRSASVSPSPATVFLGSASVSPSPATVCLESDRRQGTARCRRRNHPACGGPCVVGVVVVVVVVVPAIVVHHRPPELSSGCCSCPAIDRARQLGLAVGARTMQPQGTDTRNVIATRATPRCILERNE
jgi:hypothetical protein